MKANTGSIEEFSFSDKKVYKINFNEDFLKKIHKLDNDWSVDFNKFINVNKDYPYTMSPKTTEEISTIFDYFIKEFREEYGWDVKRWFGQRETYVLGVLRKILIPDTFEPSFFNIKKLSAYLKELYKKNNAINVRSFFTGAGLADKSLLIQLFENGVKDINLITTDYSSESLILAAINLEIWNSSLSTEERYDIFLINGDIPEELFGRRKTVVLQIRDALYAINEEHVNKTKINYSIDGLLLDNGLQYVSSDFGRELLQKTIELKGKNGLFIAIIGLDPEIEVRIDSIYQLKEILRGSCVKRFKKLIDEKGFNTPFGYEHFYLFTKEENITNISRVYSMGAARLYDWLHHLFFKLDIIKFMAVLKAIKSATNLSKASSIVKTSPFKTYLDLKAICEDNKLIYHFEAKPMDISLYSIYKEKLLKMTEEEQYKFLIGIDPQVLRISLLKIE